MLGAAHSGVRWVGSGAAGTARISGGVEIGPWKSAVSAGNQQCAADHGKTDPCCSQPGEQVVPQYVCPASAPICVDYVYNQHWGHCSVPPIPLSIVTADVSKFKVVQDRHLFVNGVRARRARLADSVASAAFAGAHMTDDGFTLSKATDVLKPGMEFVFPQSTSPWTEPRCAIADVSANMVLMKKPCWHNLVHKACGQGAKGPPVGSRGYVENAGLGSISAPGDWALEGATVHYALRPGESVTNLTVTMPVLETLVNLTGASDVQFDGLAFEHATWLRPGQDDGYVEQQTGCCAVGFNFTANANCGKDDSHWSVKCPGNIAINEANSIGFVRCEFTRMGGVGLDFTSAKDCVVDSCYFHDISAAAVQIGQFQDPLATSDVGNVVRNTIVNRAGAEFSGSAGINVGYTQGTVLWGNDVSNQAYTPISVGWGWSRHENWYETNAANNTIAFNNVHDYKQSLNDGGGIYMLGPQNGSQIHDNWLHNQHTSSSGALYPDEGSAYSRWYHNVVTNIGNSKWLHLWTSSIHDVTVEDNFADTKNYLNHGTRCPMINNTVFNAGQPPSAAAAIMNASGVNKTNPFRMDAATEQYVYV